MFAVTGLIWEQKIPKIRPGRDSSRGISLVSDNTIHRNKTYVSKTRFMSHFYKARSIVLPDTSCKRKFCFVQSTAYSTTPLFCNISHTTYHFSNNENRDLSQGINPSPVHSAVPAEKKFVKSWAGFELSRCASLF